MDTKQILDTIIGVLKEKKATDIVAIPVAEKTTLADYFVMASATTVTHLRSLEDDITSKLKEDFDLFPLGVEGREAGRWILIDYAAIVVHLMHKTEREYYALDKFWQGKESEIISPDDPVLLEQQTEREWG